MIVGRDEQNRRQRLRRQSADDGEAVELGHLDVEEYEVRPQRRDRRHRRRAIAAFADDADA